jgi:hypothetical protein
MTLVLLATLLGVAQPVTAVPLLRIAGVRPLQSIDVNRQGRCLVVLENVHSSPAMAWVLEQRSTESTKAHGASWDSLRAASRQIAPNKQFEVETACADPARPFEVAGVIYADGTFAGSAESLINGVLTRRRLEAAGLRELITLVTVAEERPGTDGTALQQLHNVVDRTDPSLDRFAKSVAKLALDNLTRDNSAIAANYPALKSAFLAKLAADIRLLESFVLPR